MSCALLLAVLVLIVSSSVIPDPATALQPVEEALGTGTGPGNHH